MWLGRDPECRAGGRAALPQGGGRWEGRHKQDNSNINGGGNRKGSKIRHFEANVNYLGKITLSLFDPVSL